MSELRADGTTLEIEDLPDGYGLFSRGSRGGRQDRYLRGTGSVRGCGIVADSIPGSCYVKQFRSPMEFVPHAAWLLTDHHLDPSNCKCRYCSTRADSLRKRRNSVSVGSTTPVNAESHPSPIPPPRTQPYASPGSAQRSSSLRMAHRSIRGTSRQASFCEVFSQQERQPQYTTVPAQVSDLTAHTQGRVHRDQELVWYILDKPWQLPERSRPWVYRTVRFWPGVLRTTFCPVSHFANPQQSAEIDQMLYLITSPSLGRTYVVPRGSIIPYQGHSPDEDFLEEARSMGPEIPLNDLDSTFDPLPRSSTLVTSLPKHTMLDIPPLDLLITDIRITKQIASIWTITDEFSTYPNPAGVDSIVSGSPLLPNAPACSGKTIARASSFRSSTGEGAERRYRGLWWGAERIWAGDFLVLSFSESMVSYTTISSPCFVQDAQSGDHVDGRPPERRKPEDKYVYLKLESLNKIGTDVCVVGALYKLVPSPGSAPSHQQPMDPGLPHPPDGFTFRPMLSTSTGAKLPIKLIRGRYYPRPPLSADEQPVLEERIFKVMEGCSQTDPGVRRPTKYSWESRGSLLAGVCPTRAVCLL